jgi:hypothetical protein
MSVIVPEIVFCAWSIAENPIIRIVIIFFI